MIRGKVVSDDRQKDETLSRLMHAAARVGAVQERARLQEMRRQRRQPRQQH